jgi:putative ABC transport system permease protein
VGTYPPPAWGDYPDWPRATGFFAETLARVAALPGVSSAALAANGPLDGGWTTRIILGDRPELPPGERDEVVLRPVSEDYFRTVGVPLLAGRGFDHRDRAGDADSVIVNRAFVEHYFGDGDPLGVTLTFWNRPRTIVGVVGNVRFRGLGEATPPAMYPPLAQVPQGRLSLLLRTAVEPTSLAATVRRAVWEVDPDIALFGVDTLQAVLADSVAQPRFRTFLLSLFAGVALLLAAVGLYGVMAGVVAQRRHEIGVRMALGASRGDVLRAVLGRGLTLTLGATSLGLLLAAGLARALASLLYGVGPADPLVFVAVSALLIAVGLVACWLPARRAALTDPLAVMRYE